MANSKLGQINIDEPRWDQSTYWGRAKHFFVITNPLNLLCSSSQLENAKSIVTKYRNGENLNLTEDQIWRAKNIYDSAFHPETGEKLILIGRMSAQVPMNMLTTGAMLTFYKSNLAVVFWQWYNQSFNAIVNYSNRSGDAKISTSQLLLSYSLATSSALVTALSFNRLAKQAPPLIQRFGPFLAVSAANCVNIPVIRSGEILDGMKIATEDGKSLGRSRVAAKWGIAAVVFSRIVMATPTMIIIPIFMNKLEKKGTLAKYPMISAPVQIGLCGLILTFSTPLACALFPQKSSMSVAHLEPELQDRLKRLPNPPSVVYYNKGL